MNTRWAKFFIVGVLYAVWIKFCKKYHNWTILYKHCIVFIVGQFIPT